MSRAFLREGTYWLSIAEHNASKRPIVYEELKTELITFLDSGLKRYPPPHYKRVVRDRSVAGYLCHLYAYCLHSAQHHLVYRGWAGGKWPRPTPDTKAKTKKVQGSDIISLSMYTFYKKKTGWRWWWWKGGFGQKSWVTMGVSTSGYTSAAR